METVKLTYEIDGDNFNAAGDASTAVKRVLKKLRLPPQIVRRAVVCMYEGEINMSSMRRAAPQSWKWTKKKSSLP